MDSLFSIIHEDADLLVINKPAGLVCHPTKGDEYSSLISRVRLHLGSQVHAQLINRLDRETSGLILIGKNEWTARALRRLWEAHRVEKYYLAIVHGHLAEQTGVISAPLGKDERSAVAIKDCVRADGAEAETHYEVQRRFTRAEGDFTVLRLQLKTGRKHQLRIHLAHIGHPIVGDKLYGPDENIYLRLVQGQLTEADRQRMILPWQGLHAHEIKLTWAERPMHFVAEPEPWFREFIADR